VGAEVEVEVLDRQRGSRGARRTALSFARRLAAELPPPEGTTGFTVVLVGDRAMRALNLRWRGRDATTDVLSFPASEGPSPGGDRPLGDVVISVPRARLQARWAGHSLVRELQVLLVHGYLHLLGHDHEADGGAMMRLQRRLERRLLHPGAGKAS
jgi:probable rRNA maturation factor